MINTFSGFHSKRVSRDSFFISGGCLGDLWQESLFTQIDETLSGKGFRLVDLNIAQKNRNVFVRVVLYRAEGFTLKDCESIHKTLFPLVEKEIPEGRDLSMEVTSPGIDRVLKSEREYLLFKGKKVLLFLKTGGEPLSATLTDADESRVFIMLEDGSSAELTYGEIQKAKLNY